MKQYHKNYSLVLFHFDLGLESVQWKAQECNNFIIYSNAKI